MGQVDAGTPKVKIEKNRNLVRIAGLGVVVTSSNTVVIIIFFFVIKEESLVAMALPWMVFVLTIPFSEMFHSFHHFRCWHSISLSPPIIPAPSHHSIAYRIVS